MPQTTVRLDTDIYKLLREYSDKTGVPVSVVLFEAAQRWYNEIGEKRLKVLTKK